VSFYTTATSNKVEDKFGTAHAMKAFGRSRHIAPFILNLDYRVVSGQLFAPAALLTVPTII
jgi:hypothetical protein